MCEYICKCIKGRYKGLEFKFTAKDIHSCGYPYGYMLFFKDLRQASDFIIKFFLNAYEPRCVNLSIDDNVVTIRSTSIKIERVVI